MSFRFAKRSSIFVEKVKNNIKIKQNINKFSDSVNNITYHISRKKRKGLKIWHRLM